MNGFLLLVPFFAIRFGVLARKGRQALARAAHSALMRSCRALFPCFPPLILSRLCSIAL